MGYKIRFQDRTRPESLIKLMTDGILLAETQADRFLDQYDTLILDEAHERSLNIDFLLGYLAWLLPRRRDLKLVITSATIDPERFARHFGQAPVINVSGRSYPVDVRYRPVEQEEGDETDDVEQDAIVNAVDELWSEQDGDILVFLSGEREIRETAESLRKRHPQGCEILPLYSRLSEAEQQRVFRPTGSRRVVLSTNVAETSLTVPGIRAVIDTGLARISRYSHRSRLQRLPIEKISQASARQRSGRCGRVGPGIAIRLYSEEDFLGRDEYTEPEILRTNLAAVILQMHALHLGDIERFPFVEPPDGRYVRDGQRSLQELGALDEAFKLTELGRRLAKLPLDPRLGRILLAAADEHCLSEVAVIVAALGVPDPRDRPADKTTQADQKHARFKDEQSDFLSLLKLWQEVTEQRKALSRARLRGWCRENFLSYMRLVEWHDIHGQILEVLKGELALKLNEKPATYDAIHRALLAGLLSNVCQRKEQGEYLGTRGNKVFIHPGSGQFKARPAWIVAAEQVETTKVYARIVARVEPQWIEKAGAHLVKQHHFDPHWERRASRVAVHERTTLFGLTLQSGRKIPFERVDPKAARELFIRHALVQMDYDSKAPFFVHNLKLLEETEYLQQKGRRVDLLVDEAQLEPFFDARVPPEATSGAAFEAWRKKAERENPRLLFLDTSDIAGDQSPDVLDPHAFPDHLDVGPLSVKLEYRFDPGHADDGVSALVPLHMLRQLDAASFDWLVPGSARGKGHRDDPLVAERAAGELRAGAGVRGARTRSAAAGPRRVEAAARHCAHASRRPRRCARRLSRRPASAASADELRAARRGRARRRSRARPRRAAREAHGCGGAQLPGSRAARLVAHGRAQLDVRRPRVERRQPSRRAARLRPPRARRRGRDRRCARPCDAGGGGGEPGARAHPTGAARARARPEAPAQGLARGRRCGARLSQACVASALPRAVCERPRPARRPARCAGPRGLLPGSAGGAFGRGVRRTPDDAPQPARHRSTGARARRAADAVRGDAGQPGARGGTRRDAGGRASPAREARVCGVRC